MKILNGQEGGKHSAPCHALHVGTGAQQVLESRRVRGELVKTGVVF